MSFDHSGRRVGVSVSALALFALSIALPAAQTPSAPPVQPAPASQAPQPAPGGQTAQPAPAGRTGAPTAKPQAAPAEPPKVPGLAGSVQGTPASDPVKAATILAEARKALGGEDKLKAVQRLELKGKSARAMGNSAVEGDFELQLELPDKFRRKEGLAISNDRGFMIDILQVLNGAVAMQKVEAHEGGGGNWEGEGNRGNRGGRGGRGNFDANRLLGISTDGLDPRAREEAEHAAIAAEMARVTAALLLTTSEPMVWIGTAQAPIGKAEVLEFKTHDGVATRLFIDEKRHLPLMISWTGIPQQLGNRGNNNNNRGGGPPNRGGGQPNRGGGNRGGNFNPNATAPLQMYFSDYKAVNGIKLPHLIQSGANDETSEELVVKTYRINPVFKPEIFVFDK